MKRLLLLVTAFVIASSLSALAATATPAPERMRQLAAELDHLEKVFMSTPQFGEKFWRESKRVADRSGPEIIHAIMDRSRKWRGEEGLIFVPVVALLPRKAALNLLRQYKRLPEPHKTWAHEFIIEFDADDVKETVREITGKN